MGCLVMDLQGFSVSQAMHAIAKDLGFLAVILRPLIDGIKLPVQVEEFISPGTFVGGIQQAVEVVLQFRSLKETKHGQGELEGDDVAGGIIVFDADGPEMHPAVVTLTGGFYQGFSVIVEQLRNFLEFTQKIAEGTDVEAVCRISHVGP